MSTVTVVGYGAGNTASVQFALERLGAAVVITDDPEQIAAAERLGAKVLYSEDLNHGQTYGSVRVENPFLPA